MHYSFSLGAFAPKAAKKLAPVHHCLVVCLSVSNFAQTGQICMKFWGRLALGQWTND